MHTGFRSFILRQRSNFAHRYGNLGWLDAFLSHADELELAHPIDRIRFERKTDGALLRMTLARFRNHENA